MNAPGGGPTVALLLPCHDEAAFLPPLLDALLPQLAGRGGWQVVAVNDASTDDTGAILERAAATHPQLSVLHARFGSPGAARTAAANTVTVLGHGAPPDWLLTTDCDVELPADFVAGWAATLAEVDGDPHIGAVNGGEDQSHLFAGLPHAARAGSAFGLAAARAEAAVGVTNLNGVNHAVRTTAYLECGPYLQPTALGPGGEVFLAGEDWDLGVRLRVAGYRIEETTVTVRDRGRRLLADPFAYVSGLAYEGAFRRVHADGPPQDIDAALVASMATATVDRVLLHFWCKVVLARPALLDGDPARLGLSAATAAAMRDWIDRWPYPTFAESRHGFVYGRLPRFAAAFVPTLRRELGLDDALAALLGAD